MSEAPSAPTPAGGPPLRPDPRALLRSRRYLLLLLLGTIVGAPIAAVAFFFLDLVARTQTYLYDTLPDELGFDAVPWWWPLPLLVIGGFIVALAIQRLPGTGGHRPAEGFKAGVTRPIELPGVAIAAFATLCCGAVLGPEAPLIAIGSGLGVLAVHLVKRDAPEMAATVIGVAGSFAAISTLLGSPIVGAFLLMEASGLGGAMLGVVLVPGMVAAGVGALIFVGLNDWTGYGTFSLAVPDIPAFTTPTLSEFLWAFAIGAAAAALGTIIRRLALLLQPIVMRRALVVTPIVGLLIGALAILFDQATDKGVSQVLFSGEDALAPLIQHSASWGVGALLLLVACKGLAYSLSLAGLRGGPVFPGMFIGAVLGMALSHLPGLPMIAGVAMGIGAMTAVMLGMPLTAVLLTSLFLQADGLALMPLVIVAVTVSYVTSAWLEPAPIPDAATSPPA